MTRYYLVRTAFHGGGILSRHRKLGRAEAELARIHRNTDCVCGCAQIVRVDELADLPEPEHTSPYSAAIDRDERP